MPQREEIVHLYCRKEKEIAEIHTDLKTIKRIVMEGNGGDALVKSVPKLSVNVENLTKIISDLGVGIRGLLRFQAETQGRYEGTNSVKKRNRYIIGVLMTVCALLLTAVGILIGKIV